MKLLQLNILQGQFIDRIIDFVEKNDVDVLCFQEVTGNKLSRGGLNTYKHIDTSKTKVNKKTIGIDCLKILTKKLDYSHEFLKTTNLVNDPKSYFGNAIFSKKNLEVLDSKSVLFNQYLEIHEGFYSWEKSSRGALLTKIKHGKTTFWTVCTHLAWGNTPFDEDYKISQAQKLYDLLASLNEPFILSGDFNVVANTQVVKMFENLGRNLLKENNITNTLNPNIHPNKKLFPAGLGIDFIFTTPEIKVNSFKLIDKPDLSDHYGLLLDFEI